MSYYRYHHQVDCVIVNGIVLLIDGVVNGIVLLLIDCVVAVVDTAYYTVL